MAGLVRPEANPDATVAAPENSRSDWRKEPAWHLAALVVVAFLFGGGGSWHGLANLCVQLAALAVIALNRRAIGAFIRTGPKSLVALVLVTCMVPLIQMIPLPPALWSTLPGRELVGESLMLTGGLKWFPISVDAGRTLLSFLAMIAPFAIVSLGFGLPSARLVQLQYLAVALGGTCALFGMIQVVGNDAFRLYRDFPVPGVLLGTFASRNTAGLFLVSSLLMLCAAPKPKPAILAWGWRLAAGLAMVMAVALTQSRTSIVLLGLPAILLAVRLAIARFGRSPDGPGPSPSGTRPVAAAVALIACLAIGVGVVQTMNSTRLATSLARFSDLEDSRPEMWEDAIVSARRFWPVGAGMGAFEEVFQIDESLEYVSPRRAGRAHNDYIEVAIEAGIAGLALIGLWLGWCLWAGFLAARRGQGWSAMAGLGIVMAAALQSLMDYPLRNQTMACMAALAIVLLAAPLRRAPGEAS